MVADPAEAGAAAARIGGPVALKILSRDITHKSDIGGVMLDLEGREVVQQAAEAMLSRVAAAAPEARLQGFTVQAMCRRPQADRTSVVMGTRVSVRLDLGGRRIFKNSNRIHTSKSCSVRITLCCQTNS